MTKIAMTNLYIYNQNEPLFDYDQRKNKHKNIRKTTVDIMSADWLEEPELTDFETPEALYVKQEMLQALNVALEQLTEEERQILIYMFGLREEPKMTIRQISQKMHISQWKVCKIYRLAICRLKDFLT